MRKLTNRRKKVNKKTWCMTYADGIVLAFIEFEKWIFTKSDYFEGTKTQIRKEARDLGLDFSEWNKGKDSKDKI